MRIESPREARAIDAAEGRGTPDGSGTPDSSGTPDGSGIPDGRGIGGGRGSGIGPGAGGRIDPSVLDVPLPVPPPDRAPVVSRARPPQLIYPARNREAEDSSLFVARLTIDPEGFVIGARLVRGVGGGRDNQAEGAVWRFRYRPALDEGGRPVQATIDQPFLVE